MYNKSEIIIYKSPDGLTKIDARRKGKLCATPRRKLHSYSGGTGQLSQSISAIYSIRSLSLSGSEKVFKTIERNHFFHQYFLQIRHIQRNSLS
jgi:hypothetical protein